MIIIFYNLAHLGDTYFSQPLISNFCFQNPNDNISVFVLYNWFIYSQIPNLKILYEKDNNENNTYINTPSLYHTPFNILNNSKYITFLNFIKSHEYDSFFIFDNILYINTWIGGNKHLFLNDGECDIKILNNNFYNLIQLINKTYGFNLSYNNTNIFPTIPSIDITSFLELRKNKKVIFYYNLLPKSCQSFPNINHDDIIAFLADYYKDYIICTAIDTNIKRENIICVSAFGYNITPCAKNIGFCCHIAMKSNIIFSFDTGACFYYCNSVINDVLKGKWFHIYSDNKYFNKFKKYIDNNNIIGWYITNNDELKSNIVNI